MLNLTIAQCANKLNFEPQNPWPSALPACAWKGHLLCGFERPGNSAVIDLFHLQHASLVEAIKACHPHLGLAELGRLSFALKSSCPEIFQEIRDHLFQEYSLRWSERLEKTLDVLVGTPFSFQKWVDEKSLGTRDLSVLLAIPHPSEFSDFLVAIAEMGFSRNEGVRAIELGAELFLMGRPLNDLLPSDPNGSSYLRKLEKWRRPQSLGRDEEWKERVSKWPWPSQVQGRWQRFGDQSGLEITLRSTSPEDFQKKLERLISIGDAWHER